MKTPVFILIATLFAGCFAQAETFTPPLFKIEKDGNTAYVLAYVAGGGEAGDLSSAGTDIIVSSSTLIIDGSMMGVSKEDMQAITPLGAENSLREQLTDDEWYKLLYVSLPSDLVQSSSALSVMPQVAPAMALQAYLEEAAQAPSVEYPLAPTILNAYIKSKKNILAFEQGKAYQEMRASYRDINELKRVLAIPLEALKEKNDAIIKAYRTDDIDTLGELVPSLYYTPESYQIAVVSRVSKWAPKVGELIKTEGQELFLFDVELVVGESGLINQLSQLGYTVTKVDQPVVVDKGGPRIPEIGALPVEPKTQDTAPETKPLSPLVVKPSTQPLTRSVPNVVIPRSAPVELPTNIPTEVPALN
jgi:uncharacterized protein YbaP (TraB family)